MSEILDAYVTLWREALGDGPIAGRYLARVGILVCHALLIMLAFLILLLVHNLRR